MPMISIKVPKGLDNKVRTLADKRRTTNSEIVRQALEQYLAGARESVEGSVLDLARDIVGSVEGPSDLSTQRKYMKGYGR